MLLLAAHYRVMRGFLLSLATRLAERLGRPGRLALATLVLLALISAAATANQKLRWRARLVGRKLAGGVAELSWPELGRMLSSSGGYNLEAVILEGRSVPAALVNPYQSTDDVRAGAMLFRVRCAPCHGSDAAGERGPPLNVSGYRHGDSDWAVYRVVRDGIPGTAMVATASSERETWQIISFIRQRQDALASSARDAGAPDAADAGRPRVTVPFSQIAAASSDLRSWLTYSRTLDGSRYSPLAEISTTNAAQLRVHWVAQLDTDELVIESSPIVAGGALYLSEPPAGVVALDVATGRVLWRFKQSLPPDLPLCCGKVNRGVAILDDTVFLGTLDATLVALDANDGRVKWTTPVATPSDGYSITIAPLVVGHLVVLGVSGGEYGIRGFVAAFDAASGREVWRFWTVPSPGEPGHETWDGDSWKTGGAPTWVTGSYDPSVDLIYWGVGNPSPNYLGDQRKGDNLFTNSVIAIRASTGQLAWHFQFTPHDEHDWDSNQTPILADLPIDGVVRKVMCWPNRNGFYYLLDRVSGQFLRGTPFVKQTWASGLDPHGRPVETDASRPTHTGTLIYPGVAGATNWQPAAFHPGLSFVFVPATEGRSVFSKSMPEHVHRSRGEFFTGSGAATKEYDPVIRALRADTGHQEWEYRIPHTGGIAGQSGLLATAGNLVLGASEGTLAVLDAATGRPLFEIFLGGPTYSPPISFLVDQDQAIVAVAGRSVFLLGLGAGQGASDVRTDSGTSPPLDGREPTRPSMRSP